MKICLETYGMKVISGTKETFEAIVNELNRQIDRDGFISYRNYKQIIFGLTEDDEYSRSWDEARGFIKSEYGSTFQLVPMESNTFNADCAIIFHPAYRKEINFKL